MAGKDAPKSSKSWSPDQPLSLDKAILNTPPNPAGSGPAKRMVDTHLAHPERGQHPIVPTSHKSFNRQKKG